MISLYENSDALNTPIECYYYDSEKEGFPVKPHWHHFMEITYVIEGHPLMRVQDVDYHAGPGDLILFHPQSVHAIYNPDGTPVRLGVIKFDINRLNMTSSYSPKLRSIYHSAERKGMPIYFPAQTITDLHLETCFDRCIREISTQHYCFDLIIHSELYELLVTLLRLWQQAGFVIDSSAYAEDDRFDIYNITEYIDAHMSENIHIPDIAKMCGMSYSYFAKKFLSIYGRTCKKYIEEMRIYKAEELLSFTDFDLTYIALETGFSDCSHLIKSFSAYRGLTPRQFRIQSRNQE